MLTSRDIYWFQGMEKEKETQVQCHATAGQKYEKSIIQYVNVPSTKYVHKDHSSKRHFGEIIFISCYSVLASNPG